MKRRNTLAAARLSAIVLDDPLVNPVERRGSAIAISEPVSYAMAKKTGHVIKIDYEQGDISDEGIYDFTRGSSRTSILFGAVNNRPGSVSSFGSVETQSNLEYQQVGEEDHRVGKEDSLAMLKNNLFATKKVAGKKKKNSVHRPSRSEVAYDFGDAKTEDSPYMMSDEISDGSVFRHNNPLLHHIGATAYDMGVTNETDYSLLYSPPPGETPYDFATQDGLSSYSDLHAMLLSQTKKERRKSSMLSPPETIRMKNDSK